MAPSVSFMSSQRVDAFGRARCPQRVPDTLHSLVEPRGSAIFATRRSEEKSQLARSAGNNQPPRQTECQTWISQCLELANVPSYRACTSNKPADVTAAGGDP